MTNDDVNSIEVDPRFDFSRPQFRKIKPEDSKLVLDDRFSAVLTDSRFRLPSSSHQSTAPSTRTNGKSAAAREQLSEFYIIHENGDQNDCGKVDYSKKDGSTVKVKLKQESHIDSDSRISHLMALARGEIDLSSSSDDAEGTSDFGSVASSCDEEVFLDAEFVPGVLDPGSLLDDQPTLTDEPSPYLAIMNLEWTSVRAVDIFAVVSSFVPPGSIVQVRVFPSDFGLERMEKERLIGPTSIWKSHRRKNFLDAHDNYDDKSVTVEESGEKEKSATNDTVSEDQAEFVESDFNPEKLRAYEVSKLKYYFGIVEFTDHKYADIAYNQVDGMEFEHSSATVDMRSIAVDDLDEIIKNRPLRDECTGVPSNYEPPEFIVNALQQSAVDCTWDVGDRDRERVLTKYTAGEKWKELAEEGRLDEYLASDISSAESSDEEGEKAQNMRKLLGLEDDSSETKLPQSHQEENEETGHRDDVKEFNFLPTAASVVDKEINENGAKSELSPWEKYKEKRKQKKREMRQNTKEHRKQGTEQRKDSTSMLNCNDPFIQETYSHKKSIEESFLQERSKSDLELLAVEDDLEAANSDYNMRAIRRVEKIKYKKLKGKRKKKEEETFAAAASDKFQVNTKDDRFRALLDGMDSRFGIDPTDPNFKETTGMRDILTEQSRRRKLKRRIHPGISGDECVGDQALDSLVAKLKKKTKK